MDIQRAQNSLQTLKTEQIVRNGMRIYMVVRKTTDEEGWVSLFTFHEGKKYDLTKIVATLKGLPERNLAMNIGLPGKSWGDHIEDIFEEISGLNDIWCATL